MRSLANASLLPAIALFFALSARAQDNGAVRIAYMTWSSSIASSHVACAVIEQRLGRECELHAMAADTMWQAVAKGDADTMLSAWLPDTHRRYMRTWGEQLVDLGPNLVGTRIGLVIPDVSAGRQTGNRGMRGRHSFDIRSIPELREQRERFGGRIIGIDPEAGIMLATRRAIEAYDLEHWRLIEGSESRMTQALTRAIREDRPIVVTGWKPHWMFGRWSLRMLEDPKQIYGKEGAIHTLVRKGLEQDMPEVQRFLDRFWWEPHDMEQLMLWIELDDGLDPYGKAVRWIDAHPGKVGEWLQ